MHRGSLISWENGDPGSDRIPSYKLGHSGSASLPQSANQGSAGGLEAKSKDCTANCSGMARAHLQGSEKG